MNQESGIGSEIGNPLTQQLVNQMRRMDVYESTTGQVTAAVVGNKFSDCSAINITGVCYHLLAMISDGSYTVQKYPPYISGQY